MSFAREGLKNVMEISEKFEEMSALDCVENSN